MDDRLHDFFAAFGEGLILQDTKIIAKGMASWLLEVKGAKLLLSRIEEYIEEYAEEIEVAPAWPVEIEVDAGDLSFEDLRDDTEEVPAGLNADNYRGWFCIELWDDQEEREFTSAWLDLWVALVEEDGALKVAFWEITDPD